MRVCDRLRELSPGVEDPPPEPSLRPIDRTCVAEASGQHVVRALAAPKQSALKGGTVRLPCTMRCSLHMSGRNVRGHAPHPDPQAGGPVSLCKTHHDLAKVAKLSVEVLVIPVDLLEAFDENRGALDITASRLTSNGVHVVR